MRNKPVGENSAPQGVNAHQASLVVFFSYFGTEAITITIAAGEAKHPAEAVRAGMRSVVWRILLFHVGAIARARVVRGRGFRDVGAGDAQRQR